jgi:MoaA/NifB/PqqE/SkfB family radical SAM enzyme
MTVTIKHLELHAAHGCNFACESCSHYSNQGHKGMLSVADAESMISQWSTKVNPLLFKILGGEPTINPNLVELFKIARRYWPNAHIQLATNGFFLHRHPTLPQVLKEIKNASIELSVHHDSEEYTAKMEPIFALVDSWNKEYGTTLKIAKSLGRWRRTYYGEGDAMEPFKDNNQRSSWEKCPAKTCAQLYDNKIWKCAPLAYLGLQKEKYNLSSSWDHYLTYTPLDVNTSEEQIKEFFAREDESYCGMCPSETVRFKLKMPIRSYNATN